ncbi:ABC transporter permease [Nocardia amikacinitolerans]|uniref:ABC transporter permease n=1 Tax=Nocardia amikacinitolerans TaxID=756689 RepID=UPI00368DA391
MRGFTVMAGVGFRGSRRQILCWVLGLAAVFAGTVWSLDSLYSTPEELASYRAATESGTALFAINGKPYGLDDLGGVIAYEFGFMSALAFPLMGIHLVTRMTRREEESGRAELLRAGSVGRVAGVAAAVVLTGSALMVVSVSMVVALLAAGLELPGAPLYSTALLSLGCCFAAIAALAAQVVASARNVLGICLAVLIAAFLLRGIGDVRGNGLVWLSPIGWAEQARPFGAARWWPVLLALGFAAVLFGVACWIAGRRDHGAGVLAARRGPTSAAPILLRPLGFALRRHRGGIAAWSLIGALVAISFGALADAIRTVMAGNAALQDVFGGGSAAPDAYLSFVVVLLALIVAGFAVQGVGRIAEDEPGDRLEPVLAGPVSRSRWLSAEVLTVACGTVVVAAVSGFALGVSDALAVGDSSAVLRLTLATLSYLPSAFVLLGLAVALYGIRPAALPVSWAAFVGVALIATLADTLRLPQWTRDLSPLEWVGRTPSEPVSPSALIASATLAAILIIVGRNGFNTRDIPMRGGPGLLRTLRTVRLSRPAPTHTPS